MPSFHRGTLSPVVAGQPFADLYLYHHLVHPHTRFRAVPHRLSRCRRPFATSAAAASLAGDVALQYHPRPCRRPGPTPARPSHWNDHAMTTGPTPTPRGTLVHPRVEIAETIERIYTYRMTTTSGGNLSIRDENGDVWITPARVDKGELRPGDMCCVKADGSVSGPNRPSSEYPFHAAVYRVRPDVRAIVHAHPVALVAFSICRREPNTALLPQAHQVCGKVGFAPTRCRGARNWAGTSPGCSPAGRLRDAGEPWGRRRRAGLAGGVPAVRDAGVLPPRRSSRRRTWVRCGT